jgi:hypothetical protein
MKKFFEPADLGLKEVFPNRGDIAAWEVSIADFWKCSNCGNLTTNEPSYYCEDCGSLMVNAETAKAKYRVKMEEFIKHGMEEAKSDVQGD